MLHVVKAKTERMAVIRPDNPADVGKEVFAYIIETTPHAPGVPAYVAHEQHAVSREMFESLCLGEHVEVHAGETVVRKLAP